MGIVEQARHLYDAGVPQQIPIPNESLFALLSETSHFYPDRIAIDFMGRTTTYGDVLIQAERAAQVLTSVGVGRGDTVAIVLPNCPQAFVAFYACMRIGAVAALHNPLAPAEEIATQFSRHGAKVAIAWEKSVALCPLSALETVFSVNLAAGLPRRQQALLRLPVRAAREKRAQMRTDVRSQAVAHPATAIRSWDSEVASAPRLRGNFPHATGDDPAVILHTGGTNGVPKSVPLTHRNIGANVNQNLFWVFKLHEGGEVFFSLLPYFHAFGLTFFLCSAVKLAATQLVLPNFDVPMALEAHRRRNVTFFVGVPPMFERIARGARKDGTDLSTIRFAVSGAMPLSQQVADLWQETSGGIILEGYGLSETSPVISGSPMAPTRRLGTLGLPFPSTEVRLVALDDPARDVEDGEPGEIIVRGPQVFQGYLNDPEETARAFTADGWFRTGDIAVCEDGYLFLSDRRKELILSGGFNVYPSQVEEAIRAMPGIKDVVVVGLPTGPDREEVTAAIICEDPTRIPTLEQVRNWAEAKLSHYALPRRIAVITEAPRNQLGKVMRRVVRDQLIHPHADEEAGAQ